MGRGPGRPVKTRGPSHGQDGCRSSRSSIHLSWAAARTGPAHQFLDDGPRPGPAHQISGCCAAAGPGPSHFRSFTARPASHFFPKFSARPGPADHVFKILGPARPGLPAHDKDCKTQLVACVFYFVVICTCFWHLPYYIPGTWYQVRTTQTLRRSVPFFF